MTLPAQEQEPRALADETPVPRGSSSLLDAGLFTLLILLSLLAALGLAALLLLATGNPALSAFSNMWEGSFGSWDALAATLNETAPLLIVALGACIAGQAGLFNIGLEGQFMVGALGGVAVALGIHASAALVLPLIFLGAAVIGGLWAGIAALLRYASGVNEVLTTLLLNFVAIELATFVLNKSYLLQAPRVPGVSGSNLQPQTSVIPDSAHLPILRSSGGNQLQFGIVIALLLAGVVVLLVRKTTWGFKLRAVGSNPQAANRFGIRPPFVGGIALFISGAFAGLASAAFLTGGAYRVTSGFSSDYGWEGLLVALVAGFDPLAAIPVALLYGAIRAGGGFLSVAGVSTSLTGVIQALIVIAVTLPALYMRRRRRRRQGVRERQAAILPPAQRVGEQDIA